MMLSISHWGMFGDVIGFGSNDLTFAPRPGFWVIRA